jgi:hypothetical protein
LPTTGRNLANSSQVFLFLVSAPATAYPLNARPNPPRISRSAHQ